MSSTPFSPTTDRFAYDFTDANGDIFNIAMTATNSESDPNTYTVTSITGTVNSHPVTGLSDFAGADQHINLLDENYDLHTGFDINGVSFVTAEGYWNLFNNVVLKSGSELAYEIPDSFQVVPEPIVTCFLPGTLINTTKGDVAVEDLQIGDLIPTLSGQIFPVKWVGIQQFEGRFLTLEKSTVCFKEGSLGLNPQGCPIPTQDLYVTADHAMVMHGSLVNSARLVNGITITQKATQEFIKVYHVDLGEHHAILANGAWTESYREVQNRSRFHNSQEYLELYPDATLDATQEPCLPAVSAQNVLTIMGELLAQIPEHQKTTNPDVHLYVDGDIVYPTEQTNSSYTFVLPAGAKTIRLLSHTSSPLTIGTSSDHRQLGYCINELVYSTLDNTSHHHIAPHSPLLEEGFCKAEEQKRRWTKGNAILPSSPFPEESKLTIKGKGLPMYLLSKSEEALKLRYQPKMGLVRVG